MSLARLTSLSTQTLSLLLERQRIQSLPTSPAASTSSLHLRQIIKNLQLLRTGILELRQADGSFAESAELLSGQYDRMRAMLGPDADANGITMYVSNSVLQSISRAKCVQFGTTPPTTTRRRLFPSKDTIPSPLKQHIYPLHGRSRCFGL